MTHPQTLSDLLSFSKIVRRAGRRHRARLVLEELEDRWLPATFFPTTFLDGSAGSGSLRDAILQSNADTGTADDVILLKSGTYSLSITNTAGQENAAAQGDLDITSTSHRLIIQGNGSSGGGATTIDATAAKDRIFQIVKPGTQVVFRGLVLLGGLARDDGTAGVGTGATNAAGGGILSNGGNLTLDDVTVCSDGAVGADQGGSGASAHDGRGGGVCANGGAVLVTSSLITLDHAVGGKGANGKDGANGTKPGSPGGVGGKGGAAQGGGVFAKNAQLTVVNSTVSANTVQGGAGGAGGKGGTVTGFSVTAGPGGAGGEGGDSKGGGLFTSGGALVLSKSVLTSNVLHGGAGGAGGAGAAASSSQNAGAGGPGGPGGVAQGGGLYAAGGTVSVTAGGLVNNQLQAGAGGLGGYGGNNFGSFRGHGGSGGTGGVGGLGAGGGLYSGGAALTLVGTSLSSNTVNGGGGGKGGTGGFRHISSHFAFNTGMGGAGGPAGAVQGGGLYATGGTVSVSKAVISGNTLHGSAGGAGGFGSTSSSSYINVGGAGPGGVGGVAQGGGLYAAGAAVTVTAGSLLNNQLQAGAGGLGGHGGVFFRSRGTFVEPGGAGGPGGSAGGGGLFALSGSVILTASSVSGNSVQGGGGGVGGMGGGVSIGGAGGGAGGLGGIGQGGGLYAGGAAVVLLDDAVASNTLHGGAGGTGGKGGRGGSSSFSTTTGPYGGRGGPGGTGGLTQGGGLFTTGGTVSLTNVTLASNSLQGGTGGVGGEGGLAFVDGLGGNGGNGGAGDGAGYHVDSGTLTLTNDTVVGNVAPGSAGGAGGTGRGPGSAGANTTSQGGGVVSAAATVIAQNTLIAQNAAGSDPDFAGNFASALNNLLGDGTGSNLPPANPDANGNRVGSSGSPIDPKLGLLGSYGGLTQTFPLLAGSPALDHGRNASAPPSDQRGFIRIANGTVDIGAFEAQSPVVVVSITTESGPANVVAGQSVQITANIASLVPGATPATPTGTVSFVVDGGSPVNETVSGGQAVLPLNFTLVGTHHIVATFNGDGNFTPSTSDSFTLVIVPGAATHFAVAAPAGPTAGVPFTITVTALDAYGNVATGYRGTVHLTSSDGKATLPGNHTFNATDQGKHTFSSGVTLRTAGSQTLSATDVAALSLTSSATVLVKPAAAKKLQISAPASVTAGTPFVVTVTALDAFGNAVTGYSGRIHFTSSDAGATLPANYQFVASDNGSHSFVVTLATAGNQTVTATSTTNSAVHGTATVTVNPPNASPRPLGPRVRQQGWDTFLDDYFSATPA